MKRTGKIKETAKEYGILTIATIVMIIGVYFFKFPNNFCFGGVTGLAVILGKVFSLSAGTYTLIINVICLVFGFLFLGRSFGIKTVYVSLLTSFGLQALEYYVPMSAPVTGEPVLELVFAIILPAASAAILFNINASGGGTDILAMILRKYTTFDIGMALFAVDLLITVSASFVFDAQTGLFSFAGLLAKSLVIDDVIESINLCKYFTVICDDPEPICEYIHKELNRSATVFRAEGSYTHNKKTIILTVMRRSQAVQLRNYIKKIEPDSFMMITNSSEIIGKGFRGFN